MRACGTLGFDSIPNLNPNLNPNFNSISDPNPNPNSKPDPNPSPTLTLMDPNSTLRYIVLGMHCCGELSLRAIEIYEEIGADGALLVPCCFPSR